MYRGKKYHPLGKQILYILYIYIVKTCTNIICIIIITKTCATVLRVFSLIGKKRTDSQIFAAFLGSALRRSVEEHQRAAIEPELLGHRSASVCVGTQVSRPRKQPESSLSEAGLVQLRVKCFLLTYPSRGERGLSAGGERRGQPRARSPDPLRRGCRGSPHPCRDPAVPLLVGSRVISVLPPQASCSECRGYSQFRAVAFRVQLR